MNVIQLQQWLNNKIKSEGLNITLLLEDGVGGSITRATFLQVFVNKNSKKITDAELQSLAKELGDSNTKRIKAVATVESGGAGWFSSGLPKILYERHYFYKFTKKVLEIAGLGWIGNSSAGGYTTDTNNNNINDSWEKLSYAACTDPDAAVKSVSIGMFQVMGSYYKELGYEHPIDMLWDARNSELGHYKMLVGYIKKVANLEKAFLKLSTNAEDCRDFAKGYNGSNYTKYEYHTKLAKAMR